MSASKLPVSVVGASGFLGGELLRLLDAHPLVELSVLAGHGSAGKAIGDVRPNLSGLGLQTIERADPDLIADRSEVALLALPHGESAMLAAELLARGMKIIDLGSDFRLRDAADYPRYYKRDHPKPALLADAFYALYELTGPPPADCAVVANPGCFATGLALGIVPLCPYLSADARITVCGVTGSSGSGAGLSPRVHHSLRLTNLAAYKVLTHQHLGELRQLIADKNPSGHVPAIDFVPHSGPIVRGIHLTIIVRQNELSLPEGLENVLAVYQERYRDQPLIGLQRGAVQLGSVVGSCRTEIGVVEEVEDGAVVITVALDNLLKGGSGQAIQNLNLLCGFPMLTAIPKVGMWP
jgi:N-acetyl-gamma-glutamyl-phosphate reductase common form